MILSNSSKAVLFEENLIRSLKYLPKEIGVCLFIKAVTVLSFSLK